MLPAKARVQAEKPSTVPIDGMDLVKRYWKQERKTERGSARRFAYRCAAGLMTYDQDGRIDKADYHHDDKDPALAMEDGVHTQGGEY